MTWVSVQAIWPSWTRTGAYWGGLLRLIFSSLLQADENDLGAVPVEVSYVLAR